MQSQQPRKQSVLGVGVSPVSYGDVLRICRQWVEQRRAWKSCTLSAAPPEARYVCVVSVHGIMTAVFDRPYRRYLNHADMATSDGMPVVWALRSFGFRQQKRVYGPNLMLALLGQASRLRHRVFFYGGTEEILGRLVECLRNRFPSLVVVGTHAPPFRPLSAEEDAKVTQQIADSDADLVFCGIGTPKQDQWMFEHKARLPGVVMLGVGAAFNFHAGEVKQSPRWMQSAGLEWLFRLAVEPRRLWKRYLLVTPMFLPLWALQKLGILKFPLGSESRS